MSTEILFVSSFVSKLILINSTLKGIRVNLKIHRIGQKRK